MGEWRINIDGDVYYPKFEDDGTLYGCASKENDDLTLCSDCRFEQDGHKCGAQAEET
jgi:hypothetical protein